MDITSTSSSISSSILTEEEEGGGDTMSNNNSNVSRRASNDGFEQGNNDTFQHRYKILEKIGEGSYSEVVRCKSKINGNYVACKRLRHVYRSWGQVNDIGEVATLRALSRHPNILQMLEIHYDARHGKVSLVFEVMDMNLYEMIKDCNNNPLPEHTVKIYMLQLMRSLSHLHKHGVFHRDIKPENILVKVKPNVLKLGDFGSVRGIFSQPPFTEYISTRWYRSPEVLLSSGQYGFKMDIWAAGCVFYETLTLQPLFPGASEIDQISKIHKLMGPPPTRTLQKLMKFAEINNGVARSKAQQSRWNHMCKVINEFSKSVSVRGKIPGREDKHSGLDSKIPSTVSQGARDLIKLLLTYDPDLRPSSQRVVNHPYFNDVRDFKIPEGELSKSPIIAAYGDESGQNKLTYLQPPVDLKTLGDRPAKGIKNQTRQVVKDGIHIVQKKPPLPLVRATVHQQLPATPGDMDISEDISSKKSGLAPLNSKVPSLFSPNPKEISKIPTGNKKGRSKKKESDILNNNEVHKLPAARKGVGLLESPISLIPKAPPVVPTILINRAEITKEPKGYKETRIARILEDAVARSSNKSNLKSSQEQMKQSSLNKVPNVPDSVKRRTERLRNLMKNENVPQQPSSSGITGGSNRNAAYTKERPGSRSSSSSPILRGAKSPRTPDGYNKSARPQQPQTYPGIKKKPTLVPPITSKILVANKNDLSKLPLPPKYMEARLAQILGSAAKEPMNESLRKTFEVYSDFKYTESVGVQTRGPGPGGGGSKGIFHNNSPSPLKSSRQQPNNSNLTKARTLRNISPPPIPLDLRSSSTSVFRSSSTTLSNSSEHQVPSSSSLPYSDTGQRSKIPAFNIKPQLPFGTCSTERINNARDGKPPLPKRTAPSVPQTHEDDNVPRLPLDKEQRIAQILQNAAATSINRTNDEETLRSDQNKVFGASKIKNENVRNRADRDRIRAHLKDDPYSSSDDDVVANMRQKLDILISQRARRASDNSNSSHDEASPRHATEDGSFESRNNRNHQRPRKLLRISKNFYQQ